MKCLKIQILFFGTLHLWIWFNKIWSSYQIGLNWNWTKISKNSHASYRNIGITLIAIDWFFSYKIFIGNVNCLVFLSRFFSICLHELPVQKIHYFYLNTKITNYTDAGITPTNKIILNLYLIILSYNISFLPILYFILCHIS